MNFDWLEDDYDFENEQRLKIQCLKNFLGDKLFNQFYDLTFIDICNCFISAGSMKDKRKYKFHKFPKEYTVTNIQGYWSLQKSIIETEDGYVLMVCHNFIRFKNKYLNWISYIQLEG